MRTSRLSRRAVLAGTAAAAALTTVPAAARACGGRRRAPPPTAGATPSSAAPGSSPVCSSTPPCGVSPTPVPTSAAPTAGTTGAARWIPLTDHLGWDDWNLLGVEAMAVDPAHPNRVYLALGTYAQSWAGNGAVLRSEDRGATWTRTDLTVKLGGNEDGRGAGERLLVDPRDSDTLWLGTRHDGLLKSTDRGATWKAVELPGHPERHRPGRHPPRRRGPHRLRRLGRLRRHGAPNLYRTADGTTWEAVPGAALRYRRQGADPGRLRLPHPRAVRHLRQRARPQRPVRRQRAQAAHGGREVDRRHAREARRDHERRFLRHLRLRRSRRRRPPPRHRRRLHQQPLGGRRHPVPDHRRRPHLDVPQGHGGPRRVRDPVPHLRAPTRPSSAGGSRPSPSTRTTRSTSSTAPAPPSTAPGT